MLHHLGLGIWACRGMGMGMGMGLWPKKKTHKNM
jgi:hypothetical protein